MLTRRRVFGRHRAFVCFWDLLRSFLNPYGRHRDDTRAVLKEHPTASKYRRSSTRPVSRPNRPQATEGRGETDAGSPGAQTSLHQCARRRRMGPTMTPASSSVPGQGRQRRSATFFLGRTRPNENGGAARHRRCPHPRSRHTRRYDRDCTLLGDRTFIQIFRSRDGDFVSATPATSGTLS